MSFTHVNFAHNEDLTDTTLISSAQSFFASKTALGNIAIFGDSAADALADKNAKQPLIDELNKDVQLIVISPWKNGTLVRDRQSMRQVLTSKDALNELSNQCQYTDWTACILLMSSANDEASFLTQVENIESGLGLATTMPSRQSKAAKTHEDNKLSNVSFPLVNYMQSSLSGLCDLSMTELSNSLALSDSVASDVSPVKILNDFKDKRLSMYEDAIISLGEITESELTDGVYLSGNVVEQINQLIAPNEQAPFCMVWALGGNEDQLAGLKAGMSL
jgi:hypothetical protein